jgi:hypothetical protein
MAGHPAERTIKAPGWLRWVGLGGVVLIVALLALLLGGMFSQRRVVAWGVHRLANRVTSALPADLEAEQRRLLERGLECVVTSLRSGHLKADGVAGLVRSCNRALADGKVGADEARALTTEAAGLCLRSGGAELMK